MKGITWLASYPKSGNTWFRAFLSNLLYDKDKPAEINNLRGTSFAGDRRLFECNMGIESSDLAPDEIDLLRPDLYRYLAGVTEKPLFMKIHDAYTYVADNIPLIPVEATAGAFYFIRNPLDVAVSYAHHINTDFDTTITHMASDVLMLAVKPDGLHEQLRQRLLSWSGHVLSWMDCAPFPICLLRYEDMKMEPLKTFTRAVRFAGLPHANEQIQKALKFSSFDVLKQQEEAEGFREGFSQKSRFFRKGEIGSWREELSEEQARWIVNDHREVMRRFGYLDEFGEIVY